MLKDSLSFLYQLKENNTREWFNQNRDWYELARNNFVSFVEALIPEIKEFDSSLGMVEAKDCLFRIYRDVRFSLNKDPYKTNMGAYMAKGGRKSPFAGYYLHLEPNESFVSGGIYMAPPEVMKSVRQEIDTMPDQFIRIVEGEKFKKLFTSLGSESLKRVPQGFQSNSPVAKYLVLKHITPMSPYTDEDITSPRAFDTIVETFRQMFPLVNFINNAIEHH
jgi:uncharacterized protein (TIGR02453 family)